MLGKGSIGEVYRAADFRREVAIAYTAFLAVLLTATGLYSTLAFDVSRRMKEIGIRMALGAARASVVSLVVRDGMVVLLGGAAAGLMLIPGGVGLVNHVLFRSAHADWPAYAAGTAVVVAVGLVASWLPARRAAAVEPRAALRCAASSRSEEPLT